jgi:YNFM family putative membrane transporter
VLGLAFLSAGLFVVQALCIGLVPNLVTEARSTAVGLYVTIYYIGGALGGLVPALAYHAAGWPGVVALVACVFLAMMGLGYRHWPTKG